MGTTVDTEVKTQRPRGAGPTSTYMKFRPSMNVSENVADIRGRQLETIRRLPGMDKGRLDERFLDRIENGSIVLPHGAECWMLSPQVRQLFGNGSRAERTIAWATQVVLDHVRSTLGANVYHRDIGTQLGRSKCRRSARKISFLRDISDMQSNHPILILPVQLGARFAGKTMSLAKDHYADNECGMGVFEGGVALLHFPDRLCEGEHMSMGVPGDDCGDFERSDEPTKAMYFSRVSDGVHLSATSKHTILNVIGVDEFHTHNATATFFVPST